MQNFKYIFLFCLVSIISAKNLFSQDFFEKKADKLFDEQVYSEAANLYALLLQENYNYANNLKIATCYEQLNMPVDAEYWYAQLIEQDTLTNPEIVLRYAQLLKLNGKYISAKEMFLRYAQYNADGFYLAATCDYALNNLKNSGMFLTDTLPLNSKFSDIAPAFFGTGILFSTNRPEGEKQSMHFYDLYYAPDAGANISQISKLNTSVNTKVHEASPAYDTVSNTLYFTRNNFSKGRIVTSKGNKVKLKIFSAQYNGGKWKPVSQFSYNSKKYSTGQTCISPDGSILLFVSDMPGGFGGTDIYYCVRKGDDWATPVNMGDIINTKGNEMFPFLSEDGKFYFASDWLPGFGGLDIFVSERETDHWKKPKNLGLPVNSSRDDYAFIIKNGAGFFSSNRPGGKGDDDIYSCLKLNAVSSVLVTDYENIPLANADVKIYDGTAMMQAGITNADGIFMFQIGTEKNYSLQVSHTGFREITISNVQNIRTGNGILPIQMHAMMGNDEQVPEKNITNPEKKPEPENKNVINTSETKNTSPDVFTYELQIGVFQNPDYAKISSLTSFGELSVKSKEGGLLSFSIIHLNSLENAEQAKATAQTNGFADAYIITYKNGVKQ